MSMDINKTSYYSTAYANSAKPADTKESKEKADETAKTENTAPEQKNEAYKLDMDKVNAMKADLKSNILAFKQMVYAMIKKQGGYADKALDFPARFDIEIDKETQLAAQEAISEDGYWGVKQTAQRTLDFAKALSGGDVSKIPTLRDAIQKGFEAAEKIWGDRLPDICYETQKKIMDTLDEWEKNGVIE